nr:uncharacterized protein LOC115865706 [Globicephala melas]
MDRELPEPEQKVEAQLAARGDEAAINSTRSGRKSLSSDTIILEARSELGVWGDYGPPPLGAPPAQPGPRATSFVQGRGAPGGHARGRWRGRVPRARAGGGGGVSREWRRRRRRRGPGARCSLLCWNVRLPRAHGAGAEQAPPRPGAPGGGGGRDGRARAGGLNTLCSPSPGSSRASTAPASNFSALSLPSPETPATKKSSPRRSGDAGLRPSSPRKAGKRGAVWETVGWGRRAGRAVVAAVAAGGGGRGRTRSEALSRADLQILWLRRWRPRRAGTGG